MSGAVDLVKRAAAGPLDVVKAGIGTAAMAFDPSTYKDPKAALKKAVGLNLAPIKNAAGRLEEDADYMGIRKSKAHKEADSAAEAAAAEDTARTNAYNDSINDTNIDTMTRSDIMRLYQNGGTSGDIASYVAAARTGKGIYGVRRINENQASYNKANPGRAQTLGGGSVI